MRRACPGASCKVSGVRSPARRKKAVHAWKMPLQSAKSRGSRMAETGVGILVLRPCAFCEREARRVILARLLRGTEPYARIPFGDRPDIRVKAILDPHSSRKTSLLASSVWACSRQAARSASFCSLARNIFFFRVQSRRWIARLIEAVLALAPWLLSQNWQCSASVASG